MLSVFASLEIMRFTKSMKLHKHAVVGFGNSSCLCDFFALRNRVSVWRTTAAKNKKQSAMDNNKKIQGRILEAMLTIWLKIIENMSKTPNWNFKFWINVWVNFIILETSDAQQIKKTSMNLIFPNCEIEQFLKRINKHHVLWKFLKDPWTDINTYGQIKKTD